MGILSQTQNQYYNDASSYGDYQFVSLDHIISGFLVSYVGENKLITKVNKADVQFHAMRGLQEFSYDILKCVKSQEIEVPNTLKMILPQDYVNYSKITRVDDDGVERVLYPTGKTSNPLAITQDTNGGYTFSGSNDFRKIQITFPAYSGLVDDDVVSLPFNSLTSNGDSVISTYQIKISTDTNVTEGANPVPSSGNIIVPFFPQPGETPSQVASGFANIVNNLGKFTAVHSGNGVVTITYKEILSTYVNETARDQSFSNQTRTAITVINAGSTSVSDNLSLQAESDAWSRYKSGNTNPITTEDYDREDHTIDVLGRRYGLDPQHAQSNGTFYIDTKTGFIHFGSSLSGKTIVLHYISDGLGTDEEMVVHKFAEEAIYKWIAYGIISSRSNMPEYIVQRFKRERFAEARKAKIRLSNIKIEEFAQIIKGLGKPIK